MPSLENNLRSHPIWGALHWLGTIYSSLQSKRQLSKNAQGNSTKKMSWYSNMNGTSSTTFLDAPKSASLMQPLLSTRMFAPWNEACSISDFGERNFLNIIYFIEQQYSTLMSLCIIPFLWRYSNPNNSCFVYILITFI